MGRERMVDALNEDLIEYRVARGDENAVSFCFEKVVRECFELCVKSVADESLSAGEKVCLKNCYKMRLEDLTVLTDLVFASFEGKKQE